MSLKYITLFIAFAKVLEPVVKDIEAAVAEGKSSDSVQVKAEKILQDIEDVISQALTAL